MKSRKGMTLVEIIVSMGLLGIIAVFTLMALTGYVTYIARTKGITQDIFTAQDGLETEIREVKAMIRTGAVTGYTAEPYVVFGRTLTGYELTESADAHELNTVVGSGLEVEFPVPEVGTIDAELFRSSAVTTNYAYGADVGGVALRATGNYTIAPGESSFIDKIQWYVSRDGFSIPMAASPGEIEIGSLYPRFPEDYEPIPGATTLTLNDLSDHIGHHIVFTVTPVASSLKMGSMANSAPLYVAGPPVIANLKLHLDASMVSRDDTLSIRIDGTDARIQAWPNLARAISSSVLADAAQTTAANQPLLQDVSFDETGFPGVWGHQAVSAAAGSNMTIAAPSSASGLREADAMTVILVAKADPAALGISPVLQGNGWSIGRTVADGAIGITSGSVRTEPTDAALGLDGEWHVYVGIWNVTSTTGRGTLTFQVDKDEFTQTVSSGLTAGNQMSTGNTIRTDGLAVAEMMVYYQNLQGTEDLEKIKTYLFEKYMPEIVPWSIRQLYPLSDTIEQGGTLALPDTVAARLMDGTRMNVAIDWSPSAVDTSVAGSFDYIGTAQADPTKTTVLSVGVIGIDHIPNVSQSCYQLAGGNYVLPLTADAVFADGVTRATRIIWDTPSISQSVAGTYVVHGVSAYDATKTVDFQLEVIRRPVTGITLSQSVLYLRSSGGSYRSATLTATVAPPDAFDPSITWTTSDAAVATVTNGGIVQGVGTGTAVITATSVSDPGVSASCTVNVDKRAVLSGVDAWQRRNNNTPSSITITSPDGNRFTGTVTVSNTAYFRVDPIPAEPSISITLNSTSPSGLQLWTYNVIARRTTAVLTVTASAPGMVPTTYTIEITRN
ncbi:MAG: Ig-like domain-containing protein [Clostridia bacterium]|nr:Ig-like domain-containing protein [Clostridia bacterium]